MDEESYDHKMRLLAIYQDNLRELEIQSARFGANPPLHIINEIKFHRQNIEEIRLILKTNAEGASFDKLLVGIEDLREFASSEVRRAFEVYSELHRSDAALVMGFLGVFSFGMLLINEIVWFYGKYVVGLGDGIEPRDSISTMISVVGPIVNLALLIGIALHVVLLQRKELIRRIGYNPFHSTRKEK